MTDETKDEASAAEPEANGDMDAKAAPDVVGNAIRLKKAGVPVIWALVVAVASAPGFWTAFLDRAPAEAKVAARVSYELMKANVEALAKANEKQEAQLEKLRDTVNAMLVQRAAAGVRAIPAPADVVVAPTLPPNLDKLVEAKLGD
jgi:hypothetical protein